jgi:hypothetical protein
MSDSVLLNKHVAWQSLLQLLNKKYGCVFESIELNQGRHYFLRPNKVGVPSFYLKFTRDWFHSFNVQFPLFVEVLPEFGGFAQSINSEYLKMAKRRGADYVVVAMPDNGFYFVYTDLWINFCEKHNLIRKQNVENRYKSFNGNFRSVREETYCLPAKFFKNLEELK